MRINLNKLRSEAMKYGFTFKLREETLLVVSNTDKYIWSSFNINITSTQEIIDWMKQC